MKVFYLLKLIQIRPVSLLPKVIQNCRMLPKVMSNSYNFQVRKFFSLKLGSLMVLIYSTETDITRVILKFPKLPKTAQIYPKTRFVKIRIARSPMKEY